MYEKNISIDEFLNQLFKKLEDHIVAAIQRANDALSHESCSAMEKEGNEKQLMTVREVADLLSVSVGGVYNWVAAKKIPCIRIGRYLRFNRSEIREWVNTNKNIARE